MKSIAYFCALFAALSASAETLYWVDTKTFNSTFDQNSGRNLLDAEKSSGG